MGKGRCRQANCNIRLYVAHLAFVMALYLADFFIIQAANTIAVHFLEHGDDAAAKLGFVDHAVGAKIEHLKPFILSLIHI